MKRVLIGSLTALALLAAGGISTFAHCRQYEYACSFVDENGDGICDNCGTCSSDRNAAAGGSCNPNHRQTARYCGNGGHHGKN